MMNRYLTTADEMVSHILQIEDKIQILAIINLECTPQSKPKHEMINYRSHKLTKNNLKTIPIPKWGKQ